MSPKLRWILLAGSAVATAAAIFAMNTLTRRLEDGANAPLVYGEIPEFALVADDGSRYTADAVRGSVWVTNFVFTKCRNVCPMLNKEMKKLQDAYGALGGFKLLSVSVDPENDTPETLAAYSRKNGSDPRIWRFVTGARDEIKTLLVKGFKIAAEDDPLMHSDRFVVIDQNMKIRGYYSLGDEGSLDKLRKDVAHLLAHPGPG